MDEGIGSGIGQRLREIRLWRGLSLRAAAGLAGFSASYLSMIENGISPVDKRSTLEAFASALRVTPSELASEPFGSQFADPDVGAAQATLVDVEAALSDVRFGEAAVTPRPWPAVAADLRLLNDVHRPAADYAAQGGVLPGLLLELQALVSDPQAPRAEVLAGLMDCYQTAAFQTKNLGARGLPALAAWHGRRVAEELDDPAWLGLAAWLRASSLGGGSRDRMRVLSIQGAHELESHLSDPRVRQMYGALHLNAALASAALRQPDAAADHLDEADQIAQSLGPPTPARGFGALYFGPDNVGIWRLAIAVELGDPGKAQELARDLVPQRIPSAGRQAMYWADLGRGLASLRATRDDAVTALLRAEELAPQRIRTYPLIRETVTDLLRHVRRDDAVGRELRGLAFRMGIAG
ncbi:MAG: helix-turn-helix domain-containing protein [Pseudonocardia sp.]